jgi:outer membrane protein assembly factor BamB
VTPGADLTFKESSIWHTAGGDNSRRGLFAGAAKIKSRPTRRIPTRGALQAPVVFDGHGTAFTADMTGEIQAVSFEGKRLWRTRVEGGVSASPAVHPVEPSLFLGTHAGWVYALDTITGVTRWRKAILTQSDPRILSDLLHHRQTGTVVLSSWGGRFVALDEQTGEARSSWDAGITPSSAVATDRNGLLYGLRAVAGKGIQLVRLSAKRDETVLFTEPESPRGVRRALVAAAPVVDDDRAIVGCVFNSDKDGVLLVWALKSESPLWRKPLAAPVQATPAILADGSLVVADLSGHLQAFTPDGAARWRYYAGCEYLLAGPVAEAGGMCAIGDPLGQIHLVGADGRGRKIFEAKRSIQARPSFSPQGRLHVPATDRTVYVF